MLYINTETYDFPRFQGDILIEFPHWDTDTTPPAPWTEVVAPEIPQSNVPQDIQYGTPYLKDSVWTFDWNVRDLTPEEIALIQEAVKKRAEKRNTLEEIPN